MHKLAKLSQTTHFWGQKGVLGGGRGKTCPCLHEQKNDLTLLTVAISTLHARMRALWVSLMTALKSKMYQGIRCNERGSISVRLSRLSSYVLNALNHCYLASAYMGMHGRAASANHACLCTELNFLEFLIERRGVWWENLLLLALVVQLSYRCSSTGRQGYHVKEK